MQYNNYELVVLVNGKPIREYSHDGKIFIEGRPNSTYSIKIKNNTHKGALAIISVDGINVISGDIATEQGAGYVVDKRSSTVIKGFRQDMNSVGAFKFCKSGSSYCNEVGMKGNNGVIGVVIVEEKERTFNYRSINICSTSTLNRSGFNKPRTKSASSDMLDCSAAGAMTYSDDSGSRSFTMGASAASAPEPEPSFSVGTTWGEEINDSAKRVEFEASTKTHMFEMYYGTKSDLKKMGVPLEKKSKMNFPKAFGEFAKPPKNWNG